MGTLQGHRRFFSRLLAALEVHDQLTAADAAGNWHIGALVPNLDPSRAVLLFRNRAVIGSVFDRVIFDVHGKPLVGRVHARPAWRVHTGGCV